MGIVGAQSQQIFRYRSYILWVYLYNTLVVCLDIVRRHDSNFRASKLWYTCYFWCKLYLCWITGFYSTRGYEHLIKIAVLCTLRRCWWTRRYSTRLFKFQSTFTFYFKLLMKDLVCHKRKKRGCYNRIIRAFCTVNDQHILTFTCQLSHQILTIITTEFDSESNRVV